MKKNLSYAWMLSLRFGSKHGVISTGIVIALMCVAGQFGGFWGFAATVVPAIYYIVRSANADPWADIVRPI